MWNMVHIYRCRPDDWFSPAVCEPEPEFNCLRPTLTLSRLRYYTKKPKSAVSATLPLEKVPHVTVIRPVKGLEPQLYECLAATFQQTYPRERFSIYICVSSSTDPAIHTLRRLLTDFSEFDAKIFTEDQYGKVSKLGPNPKIRNMSQAYKEAKGDIIWILDCNVWVGKGVAARMVDKLCGYEHDCKRAIPYKLVHQLPLVVDCMVADVRDETPDLPRVKDYDSYNASYVNTAFKNSRVPNNYPQFNVPFRTFGGRLEEAFMSSSHAKFYTAINTVSVAPCIVGKSNMFRKSHLDYLTSRECSYAQGIDFFSNNICEDHLMGDLLWRKKVPEENAGQKFYKHGLLYGDLAIQPMAGMSITEYIGRRVRWLRVRKWTVALATLVEPGVEPFLCSFYGAFSLTYLSWSHHKLGVPLTWVTFLLAWLLSISAWMWVDLLVYVKLQSGASVEFDTYTPSFARPPQRQFRRPLRQWVAAWLIRETLALPIWFWACFGGTIVTWRGKQFHVNFDMTVSEIMPHGQTGSIPRMKCAHLPSKHRKD